MPYDALFGDVMDVDDDFQVLLDSSVQTVLPEGHFIELELHRSPSSRMARGCSGIWTPDQMIGNRLMSR
jgi:hypothetical protein